MNHNTIKGMLLSLAVGCLLMVNPAAFADQVQISDVNNFVFKAKGNSKKTLHSSDDLCVYSSTGEYQVEINPASGHRFVLSKGGKTTSFQVRWNNQRGTRGNVLMKPSAPRRFDGASKTLKCSDGLSANLEIILEPSTMPAGLTSNIISITITP